MRAAQMVPEPGHQSVNDRPVARARRRSIDHRQVPPAARAAGPSAGGQPGPYSGKSARLRGSSRATSSRLRRRRASADPEAPPPPSPLSKRWSARPRPGQLQSARARSFASWSDPPRSRALGASRPRRIPTIHRRVRMVTPRPGQPNRGFRAVRPRPAGSGPVAAAHDRQGGLSLRRTGKLTELLNSVLHRHGMCEDNDRCGRPTRNTLLRSRQNHYRKTIPNATSIGQ